MRHGSAAALGMTLFLAGLGTLKAQPVVPGELLGSTGNQGASLITIDPDTGASSVRCALGTLGPVTEIEYRADGTLFGSTGGGTANIISIDPTDCGETLVGQHAAGAVNGLEFVGGTLYGAYFATPKGEGPPLTYLVTVDLSDGSLTNVGEITGFSPVRGMAYDAETQTLYAVGGPVQALGTGDALLSIDLGTGQPTAIGSIGLPMASLEFGPDGVLYAGADGPQPTSPTGGAPLYSVDVATGQATLIGVTGASGLSGLAFVPGGQDPIVAIPTLSGAGIALLALALVAAAFVALRRG